MKLRMKNISKLLFITVILLPISKVSGVGEKIEFTNPYKLFISIDKKFAVTGKSLSRASGTLEKSTYMASSRIPVGDKFRELDLELLVENISKAFVLTLEGADYEVNVGSPKSPKDDDNGIWYFNIVVRCPQYDFFLTGELNMGYIYSTLVHIPKEAKDVKKLKTSGLDS